MILLGKN